MMIAPRPSALAVTGSRASGIPVKDKGRKVAAQTDPARGEQRVTRNPKKTSRLAACHTPRDRRTDGRRPYWSQGARRLGNAEPRLPLPLPWWSTQCARPTRVTNKKDTMSKIHPKRREALLGQLQRSFHRQGGEYRHFLSEAREVLSDKKEEARFEFIIRRLWFDLDTEECDDWRAFIQARYDRFATAFEWTKTGQSIALEPALVERTLSLWQQHWPLPMTARHAAEMIVDVRRLAEVAGGVR